MIARINSSRDELSKFLDHIINQKYMKAYHFDDFMGLSRGTLGNIINGKKPITNGIAYAICMFFMFSYDETIEFFNLTDLGLGNHQPDILFLEYIKAKKYELRTFVEEVIEMVETENSIREAEHRAPFILDKFFYKEQLPYTNMTYSKCLDGYGIYNYKKTIANLTIK